MNRKAVEWLCGELPDLVNRGVLTDEAAQQLRAHYEQSLGARRSTALIIFSILGSVLVGFGIILLLAYNWPQFGRPMRTILAIGPLIVGEVLAGWTILRRADSVAWREGAGTFLTLAIAASIALVAQTYHIPGDLGGFLLLCSLLAVPIIYVMRASLPAFLYLVGITVWAGHHSFRDEGGAGFWLLITLFIPHFAFALRAGRYSQRSVLLSWALCFCLIVSTGFALDRGLQGLWIVVFSSLFATFYLVGAYWFSDASKAWQQPFHAVGGLGLAVLCLILTYEDVWPGRFWNRPRAEIPRWDWATVNDIVLAIALPITAIVLLVTCRRRGRAASIFFGVVPILAIVGYSIAAGGNQGIVVAGAFSVLVLAMSVSMIVRGIRTDRLDRVNAGILLLSILILLRFLDSDLSFPVRAIAFIVVGSCFFASNMILVRRRRSADPGEAP